MEGLTGALRLDSVNITKHSLTVSYTLDGLDFHTIIAYEDVDFSVLRERFPPAAVDALIAHIAVLAGIKHCSLAPSELDVSSVASGLCNEFIDLYKRLYHHIFAQHRYENGLTGYRGPRMVYPVDELGKGVGPLTVEPGPVPYLLGNGGGKDSLVSMRLLEDANAPFSTYQYAHSAYGDAEEQHLLLDGVADIGYSRTRHRATIEDDFLRDEVKELAAQRGISTFCDAETPQSVFQAAPIMLSHGYRYLVVGHERSADAPNLIWEATGEEVNHQWGKSVACDRLLDCYLNTHLIENARFFSILRPIHDRLIFQLLRREKNHIAKTSSCNVEKPWCKRCPKCVYVWLSFMAYLDEGGDSNIFGENLFDESRLFALFDAMMGRSGHKPFECIGEVGEVQLALATCLKKDLRGAVLDTFKEDVLWSLDLDELQKKYARIYRDEHDLPASIRDRVLASMEQAAKEAVQ